MPPPLQALSSVVPLWQLTRLRRKASEALGIKRFSSPSYAEMAAKLRRHCPEPGFFVEAGAVDGFFESNTYELETFHGWRGILIEPVPQMFRRIAVNRPRAIAVNCALVADETATPYVDIEPQHAMSRVITTGAPGPAAAPVRVPTRTLSSILDQYHRGPVDLLSLDIEGYEPEALKGLDFSRHKPRFLCVECLTPEARRTMDAVLERHYRVAEDLNHRDVLYQAR